MKASEARKLKIDDRVTICTSSQILVGVIAKIDWPSFLIALVDSKGRRYYRTRKYKSIRHVTKADRVPVQFLRPQELPSWLQMPTDDDCEIAADYCTDMGLDNVATVLRDPRCGLNQLNRLDAITIYRDMPNVEQMTIALDALSVFPSAHAKLAAYIERLIELNEIGRTAGLFA